jgi:predicted enzyme related to lactoylglutathione lyase
MAHRNVFQLTSEPLESSHSSELIVSSLAPTSGSWYQTRFKAVGPRKIDRLGVKRWLHCCADQDPWKLRDVMAASFHTGAVLYAKNLALVKEFYQAVLGLNLEHVEDDHVVLSSPTFQLVILKVPEHIASSIEIGTPARRRTETPIKLVFEVPSISEARAIAHQHGGELFPPEREWTFQGYRVCDGMDPEGNVVQFRQR